MCSGSSSDWLFPLSPCPLASLFPGTHNFEIRPINNIEVQDEATNANVEVIASYSEDLAKIIHEDNYTKRQIFYGDETSLYWKKMSSRTF